MVNSAAHRGTIESVAEYFRELLWVNSTCKLYCIIDAAQDKLIHKMITLSAVDYCCLYKKGLHFPGERLTEELASAAPYLLMISPDDPFLVSLLSWGWGRSWGIFLFSERSIHAVHEHCSGNLLTLTEEGQVLQFRYYDPRILRVYLPTCTVDELSVVFGPVAAYLTEDENGGGPILFTRKNGLLYAQMSIGKPWVPPVNPLDEIDEYDDDEDGEDIEMSKGVDGSLDVLEVAGGYHEPQVTVFEENQQFLSRKTVIFEMDKKAEVEQIELIPQAELHYSPDKYMLRDLPEIDCDTRKHLCKQRCCTLIFALTEQDVREGIVKWDPTKPYRILRDEKRYCVHLVDGRCSIYENRPAVCRKLDCRNDRRMWMDFEGMVAAE